jgi:hypothetical protein
MASTRTSRDPSRAQLASPSRTPSRLDAKARPYSAGANLSPGLSSNSRRLTASTRYLELRLVEVTVAGKREPWLTGRDAAILQALDSYRYLDRRQIQALFFEGPRSCQYRLKWLVDHGMVHAWKAVIRPGHVRSASIYLLTGHGARILAQRRDDDPRPFILRAEHALARHHHIIHDLEANQFFVDLAADMRGAPSMGLYHWVGEHGIRRAYAQDHGLGPVPDGWGRVLVDEGELFLHLEWDRGSEQARRLYGKLAAYVSYFRDRPQASCNHVLLVVPTEERHRQARRVAAHLVPRDHECCRIWTAVRADVARSGPLAAIWSEVIAPASLVAIPQMPSRPGPRRPVDACIGKPQWWEQRPGGGEGV